MAETIISIVALFVALGSMYFAWQQVKLAKETRSQTEVLLTEIDSKVKELKSLTRIIKSNVEDTIRDLISNNNENLKILIEKLPVHNEGTSVAPTNEVNRKKTQDDMIQEMLPELISKAMEDPDNFMKFINTVEGLNKK